MSDVTRFGVILENDLLESFDELVAARGYATRSEALRDLMRDALVQSRLEAKHDTEVLGSLTLVYDHDASELTKQMAARQHDYHNLVISVLHVHISHDDRMEVIAMRGSAGEVRSLADALLSLKGVKHGKLFVTLPSHSTNARLDFKQSHGSHHHHAGSPRQRRAG